MKENRSIDGTERLYRQAPWVLEVLPTRQAKIFVEVVEKVKE